MKLRAFHGSDYRAIEEIIIENRQLKIRIKESTSISQEVLAGMNSELARYKN